MANENEIVISASLDLNKLEKDLKQFATKFRGSLEANLGEAGRDVGLEDALDQKSIDAATKALKAHRAALIADGLTQKEADKETNRYTNTINKLQASLDNINRLLRLNGGLTDKEIARSRLQRATVDDLTASLNKLGIAHAKANVEVRRGEAFMESFGFRVGILGFGFGILGGHLQRFSQLMVQSVTSGAKLIEPLERIRNLLFQDPEISATERGGILEELNRLADFPGSTLETTAKTFRSLQTLGLATADTLKLLEGLTKATARSGIGAEGLDRIAAQLRDFMSTGVLKQQEVRSIISAGGKDVADIFATQFGGTTAETLNQIGPERVLQVLIEELGKLPKPLETVTDKLNKMQNAITKVALALAPLISPGLDGLVNVLNNLVPIINDVIDKFKALPQGIRDLITTLLVLAPIIAAVTAGLFTLISALGIGVAAFKQVRDALRDTRGLLLGTESTVGKITGTVRAAGTELTLFGAVATRVSTGLKKSFAPVAAIFTEMGTAIKATLLNAGNKVGFASGLGAGTRFIDEAVRAGDVVAFITKGTLAASFTALTASLGGLIRFIPRLLGFTGPIGIIINLLLSLITNAGKARDVVVDALGGLSDAFSRLFATLGTTNADVLNTIWNILGAITTLIGGALGAALAGIITQITAIVDAMTAIVTFIQDPSWQNFKNIIYEILTSTIEGLGVAGGLLAAAFLDAIAEALKDTRLGALLGTDALTGVAKQIRDNIRDTYNTAPIDKATASVQKSTSALNEFNDELEETDKLMDNLEKSVNKLHIEFSRMLTDLTTKQLRFNLSLQAEREEAAFDEFAERDPRGALAQLDSFLQKQATTAITGIKSSTANEVKSIGTEISRVVEKLNSGISKDSVLSKFLGTDFSDAANRFRDALVQVQNATLTGDMSLQSYAKSLDTIKGTSDVLTQSLLGADFSRDLKQQDSKGAVTLVSGDRALGQSKILDNIIKESLNAVGKLRSTLGDQAEEEQRINNNVIKQQEQKRRNIEKLIKAIDAENEAQKVRLELQKEENALAIEEERVQELRSQGEYVDLSKIEAIRTNIIALRAREATIANFERKELETTRIANQKNLETAQLKFKTTQDELNALKELSKVQEQLFRDSLGNLRTFIAQSKQGLTDLTGAPGLGTFIKQTEFHIQKFIELENLLNTEVRDARQRLLERDVKFFAPADAGAPLGGILDKISGRDLNTLKNDLTLIVQRATQLEERLNTAKEALRQTVLSGDKTSGIYTEQVNKVQQLTEEALSYAKITAFINALINRRTKAIDDQTAAQLRSLETARAEAQWRQEILELQLETIQLQAAREAQQAQRGDIGLGDVLGGIQSRRGQVQEKEIELIKQKYILLKNELEIRRLNLEAQLLLAKKSKEEVDAMNKVFADRLKILEENEKFETTIRESADQADPFTRKLYDIADAFTAIYSAAREARNALSDFFNQAASGELALDALYKGLTEGISATDVVATAFFTMASAIGQALIQSIRDGDNFLESLSAILGGVLIKMGEMLIQMAAVSVAMAFAGGLARSGGNIWVALADAALALPWAILLGAAGVGLIAAGTAMGGGGSKTTANQNTASGADRSTGAQRNTFEPNKDPRFVFQKTMLATIQLEIKTDDSQIIKAVINGVNQNGRLTRLIGNRKLEFTV